MKVELGKEDSKNEAEFNSDIRMWIHGIAGSSARTFPPQDVAHGIVSAFWRSCST